MVVDFGEPFLADVLEGGRRGDRKADEEDVGLRVGQGTQTVVILLTGGIEQAQGVGLITDPDSSASLGGCLAGQHSTARERRQDLHDGHGIIVKHCRHVFGGELVGGV